jgi:hypothetical protein
MDLPSCGNHHPYCLADLLDLTKLREIGVDGIFLRVAAVLKAALGCDVAAIRMAELRALAHANPRLAPAFLAEEERRWAVMSSPSPAPEGAEHA